MVGLGGVGSWAVEALARSGVGHLTLIDADDLCVSNTNRQLPALARPVRSRQGRGDGGTLPRDQSADHGRVGREFLTPTNLAEMLDRGYDLVLDACDSFRSKVEMIAWCRRRKLPLIVVGSAGGRTDPTQVRVRDLSRTEHDAMLALVRKKLRGEFNFPKNADRYFGVPAVYSLENVRYPQADGTRLRRAPAARCATPRSSSIAAPDWVPRRTSPAPSPSPRSGKALEMLLKPRQPLR